MEEQDDVFVNFRIQYDGKSSEGVWSLEDGEPEELIDVMAFFYAQSEEFRYIMDEANKFGRALFVKMN